MEQTTIEEIVISNLESLLFEPIDATTCLVFEQGVNVDLENCGYAERVECNLSIQNSESLDKHSLAFRLIDADGVVYHYTPEFKNNTIDFNDIT